MIVKIMYNIIIVGAGPAGLAAGIYSSFYGLRTLILESKKEAGGRALKARSIINYPGFPEKITGRELVNKMVQQAEEAGAEIHTSEEVISFSGGKNKRVETKKATYYSKALILATGAGMMGLGLEGETWIGDGISYCFECGESLMKEKDVIVIGNTQRAINESVYLSKIAQHVWLVNHANLITLRKRTREKLHKNGAELLEDFVGEAVRGETPQKQLVLRHSKDSSVRKLTANIVLVVSPTVPFVSVLRKAGTATHRAGCVVVDEFGRTNIEGIFAAGSCASTMKDIIPSCVGDGTTVAAFACLYVKNKK